MKLSVLIPVYAKDSPLFLAEALQSMQAQSLPAEEIVIVLDGPVGEDLRGVIAGYASTLPLQVLALPRNIGLGGALRAGVERCRGVFVARMDADDISVPGRLQLQMDAFDRDPGLDVVGGAIAEFTTSPQDPVAFRRLPETGNALKRYARTRSPLNHVTVMFRRQAVLEAGNYESFPNCEDYHLWVRMLLTGSRFLNVKDVLVHVRAGNGMLGRRSGIRYAETEIAFQRFLCSSGFISPAQGACNAMLRVPVRLAPLRLRKLIYQRVLRSQRPSAAVPRS